MRRTTESCPRSQRSLVIESDEGRVPGRSSSLFSEDSSIYLSQPTSGAEAIELLGLVLVLRPTCGYFAPLVFQLLLFQRVVGDSDNSFSPTKVLLLIREKKMANGKGRQHPPSERKCHGDMKPECYSVGAQVSHFLLFPQADPGES